MSVAILRLNEEEKTIKEMGIKARNAVVKYYSRPKFIDRMESNFRDLIDSGKINPRNREIDIIPNS